MLGPVHAVVVYGSLGDLDLMTFYSAIDAFAAGADIAVSKIVPESKY